MLMWFLNKLVKRNQNGDVAIALFVGINRRVLFRCFYLAHVYCILYGRNCVIWINRLRCDYDSLTICSKS